MDNMLQLSCPLCCKGTFNSKVTLVEHLSNYKSNFRCPICELKVSSITLLLKHLKNSDCKSCTEEVGGKDINEPCLSLHNIDDNSLLHPKSEATSSETNFTQDDYQEEGSTVDHVMSNISEHAYVSSDDTKMYVELLQKASSSNNTHFLEQGDHSKYTVVPLDDTSGSSIITKQNSDGTISITAVKEREEETIHLEAEPVISVKDTESDGKEEIFSCNTCGVVFTSVIEHIQNYHKDEDVVVEMNEGQSTEDCDGGAAVEKWMNGNTTEGEEQPLDTISIKPENTQESVTRRVITETGDIVETISSSASDNINISENLTKDIPMSSLEMEVVDKKGRVFTRRYVQIDKFSEVDKVKTEPKTPFHQVVIKEIVTRESGEKMKVFNCIACHIYVTELQDFKLHPCKTLKYSCLHCPVSYENAKSLSAHMKVHKVPKPPPSKCSKPASPAPQTSEVSDHCFRCDVCSTLFTTHKSLKLHKRMHDPVKSREIEPPVKENNDEQVTLEKYLCTQCNKWIPIGYRSVHNNFHKSTENLNCEICNKKFTSSNYLQMHMNVHNVEKAPMKKQDETLPYTCLYCDRKFARPHEKVKHERIHTGEKPHTCAICGKSFRVSYCLTLHMRTHTGARPYHCTHCGKRFKAHSVYNHHLLTHSDVRAYKCPFCPKAFKTSVQLAGHKNSHTKPFSCAQCNRPFASLYAVRIHTETHRRQNNLKFCCTLCGASYARSFALKDHMKQVHREDEQILILDNEEWKSESVIA